MPTEDDTITPRGYVEIMLLCNTSQGGAPIEKVTRTVWGSVTGLLTTNVRGGYIRCDHPTLNVGCNRSGRVYHAATGRAEEGMVRNPLVL